MLDWIISGARVYDGRGGRPFEGDMGIRGGRIEEVCPAGGLESRAAAHRLDARGLALCPGFIDAHSHDDLMLEGQVGELSRLSQGITTELAGQCGLSLYPTAPGRQDAARRVLSVGRTWLPELDAFDRYENYRDYLKKRGLAVNLAQFVGHGALRLAVMGEDDRAPSPEEMSRMQALLRRAMEQGALGLSSGLIYSPGVFARREELIELCRVIAPFGGVYTTHMRDEADFVLEALDEAIGIAREAGTALNISHIKAMGRKNWGASAVMLERIGEARRQGMRVTMDLYPYQATCTSLNICIPPRYFAQGRAALLKKLADPALRRQIISEMQDESQHYNNNYLSCGGFEHIMADPCPGGEGMTLAQYARKLGKDPFDAYFDLLIETKGEANGIYFCIGEEDVLRLARDPACFIGSDGTAGHPRLFGTFPQAIQWFCREKGLFRLEEMIRRMTDAPARAYRLAGKGRLAPGMDADLILFEEEALRPRADYGHPEALTEGIRSVWVAGQEVYREGKLTGKRPGRLIGPAAL